MRMTNQPQQFFTLKMCQLLSSLAPEMEGHYYYVKNGRKIEVWCETDISEFETGKQKIICPVWQVEDVLWNIEKIFPNLVYSPQIYVVAREIVTPILDNTPDTAYQKIEEYLWTILK